MTTKKSWIEYEKDEVKRIILKLADAGKTQSEIGLILRDQYGIPSVKHFGFTIQEFLEAEKPKDTKNLPEDIFNLLKKAVRMYDHLEKHKKDKKGRHSLQLVESKIRRLAKYYIRKKKLPKDWKYTIEKAKLIVK